MVLDFRYIRGRREEGVGGEVVFSGVRLVVILERVEFLVSI